MQTTKNAQISDIFGDEAVVTINLNLISADRALAFIDNITYEGLLEAEV